MDLPNNCSSGLILDDQEEKWRVRSRSLTANSLSPLATTGRGSAGERRSMRSYRSEGDTVSTAR